MLKKLKIPSDYADAFSEHGITAVDDLILLERNELRELLPDRELRKKVKKRLNRLKDDCAAAASVDLPTNGEHHSSSKVREEPIVSTRASDSKRCERRKKGSSRRKKDVIPSKPKGRGDGVRTGARPANSDHHDGQSSLDDESRMLEDVIFGSSVRRRSGTDGSQVRRLFNARVRVCECACVRFLLVSFSFFVCVHTFRHAWYSVFQASFTPPPTLLRHRGLWKFSVYV